MVDIVAPQRTERLIDEDGRPTQRFHDWMVDITDRLNPLIVAASPEGIFRARRRRIAIDPGGAPGARVFVKTTEFADKTGWLPIA